MKIRLTFKAEELVHQLQTKIVVNCLNGGGDLSRTIDEYMDESMKALEKFTNGEDAIRVELDTVAGTLVLLENQ